MPSTLILVGDVNLMNLDDPAVPFARIGGEFAAADAIFGNLECLLYDPPDGHSLEQEGFFADPAIGGEALRLAPFCAVGIANNVNYGAAAILGSVERLDRLGIAHSGAGANIAAARAPALVERAGLRIGFLQRSSVYWPTNHEAGDRSAGIERAPPGRPQPAARRFSGTDSSSPSSTFTWDRCGVRRCEAFARSSLPGRPAWSAAPSRIASHRVG